MSIERFIMKLIGKEAPYISQSEYDGIAEWLIPRQDSTRKCFVEDYCSLDYRGRINLLKEMIAFEKLWSPYESRKEVYLRNKERNNHN